MEEGEDESMIEIPHVFAVPFPSWIFPWMN